LVTTESRSNITNKLLVFSVELCELGVLCGEYYDFLGGGLVLKNIAQGFYNRFLFVRADRAKLEQDVIAF
jgi:hypothetical protein